MSSLQSLLENKDTELSQLKSKINEINKTNLELRTKLEKQANFTKGASDEKGGEIISLRKEISVKTAENNELKVKCNKYKNLVDSDLVKTNRILSESLFSLSKTIMDT